MFTEWLRFWTLSNKPVSAPALKVHSVVTPSTATTSSAANSIVTKPSGFEAPTVASFTPAKRSFSESPKMLDGDDEPREDASGLKSLPNAFKEAAHDNAPALDEFNSNNVAKDTYTKPPYVFNEAFSEAMVVAVRSFNKELDSDDEMKDDQTKDVLETLVESSNNSNTVSSIARNRPKRGCSIRSQKCISDYFRKK